MSTGSKSTPGEVETPARVPRRDPDACLGVALGIQDAHELFELRDEVVETEQEQHVELQIEVFVRGEGERGGAGPWRRPWRTRSRGPREHAPATGTW